MIVFFVIQIRQTLQIRLESRNMEWSSGRGRGRSSNGLTILLILGRSHRRRPRRPPLPILHLPLPRLPRRTLPSVRRSPSRALPRKVNLIPLVRLIRDAQIPSDSFHHELDEPRTRTMSVFTRLTRDSFDVADPFTRVLGTVLACRTAKRV